MSGSKDIVIEQLRAEVERLRDDRAELQERCNRLSAEKAEALRMLADAEDLANEANAIQTTDALRAAESEIDALRRQLASRTEAIQTSLATTRELRERAEKAERERDEARAERDARPNIPAEDAHLFVEWWDSDRPSTDSAVRVVNTLRAHATKTVKP